MIPAQTAAVFGARNRVAELLQPKSAPVATIHEAMARGWELQRALAGVQFPSAGRIAASLNVAERQVTTGRETFNSPVYVAAVVNDILRLSPGEGEGLEEAAERLTFILRGGQSHQTSVVRGGGGGVLGGVMKLLGSVRPGPEAEEEPSVEGSPLPEDLQELAEAGLLDPRTHLLMIRSTTLERGEEREVPTHSGFRIIRKLGSGGMGKVYLARQRGVGLRGGRLVALKIISLPPERLEEMLPILEREASIQGSIRSPRIVQIYAAGRVANGRPFLAIEYLPGKTLREWLFEKRDSLGVEEMTSLMIEAVASVWESQRKTRDKPSLIHRDVKPDNMFVAENPGEMPTIKLADFGTSTTEEEVETERGTSEDGKQGWRVGTGGYCPPEIFSGKFSDLADDVFALGVTLFEMWSGGYFPWDGDKIDALLAQLAQPDLPEPAQEALLKEVRAEMEREVKPSDVRDGIPPALERVIIKAMSLKSGVRYRDAGEMLADLVLVPAQKLVDEAAELTRDTDQLTEDDLADRLTEHRNKMQEAIRLAFSQYLKYRAPAIRDWILEKQLALNQEADYGIPALEFSGGDEREVRRTQEAIERLDPEKESVAAQVAFRPAEFRFYLDSGGKIPAEARPRITIFEMEDRGGYLRQGKVVHEFFLDGPGFEFPVIQLPRGPHSLRMIDEAGILYPVMMPLPPWQEAYVGVRIPAYRVQDIPGGWVIVPAGSGRRRDEAGSLTERLLVWRNVPRDLAFGPMVDHGEWLSFLLRLREQGASDRVARFMPGIWHRRVLGWIQQGRAVREGELVTDNGRPVHPRTPVSHLRWDQGLEYFRVMRPGSRPPTPDELRRALFGNDARTWPHGDGKPRQGMYNARIPTRTRRRSGQASPPSVLVRNDEVPRRGDISPFSVRNDDGSLLLPLAWLASGLRKFLTNDDPIRFLDHGTGDSSSEAALRALVGGVAYTDQLPEPLEILRSPFINSPEAAGLIGFLQVLPLRDAAPTPDLASIIGGS